MPSPAGGGSDGGNRALQRFGEAEEVAQVVALLLASSYVTGQVVRVDGGWHG